MAKTVTFPGPNDAVDYIVPQYGATVYISHIWPPAWVETEELYPLEVTWSVAPTLPVAVLEMDYGLVRPSYRTTDAQGNETLGFQEIPKYYGTGLIGSYVKIVCETLYSENLDADNEHESQRIWYGVIEEVHDQQHGVDAESTIDPVTGDEMSRCHGRLTIVAYGLEKLLTDHQVLTSTCEGMVEIGVPLDFNRAGPNGVDGNRSADDLAGVYVFATKPSTKAKWSTRQIVKYLLSLQVPHDETGAAKFTWSLDASALFYVPDNDEPLLKADNATTYSLLSQLLDRRRGVLWWCDVDPDDHMIVIHVNSIAAVEVAGTKYTLAANADQVDVKYDADPLTSVVVNSTDLPRYDQVVVRGPRIRCVGTFSAEDGTLEPAWTSDEEELYEAGGTPHPAGTALKTKETRNDAVRRAPKLANVFALFRVPEDWDLAVGDGEGAPAYPLFVDDENEAQDECYLGLTFDQTLPILEGEDYEGTQIRAGQVPLPIVNKQEMRPLCFFRRPYRTTPPYKYQPAEGVNASRECTKPTDNERLQCHLSVPPGTLTVRLNVSGMPQHAIAFADFQPIANEDKPCGQMDWRKAVFTLSIESQFHTEGRWPDPPSHSFAVRRKIIYAGDQYYQHYVAPQTVVGIDEDGYLIRSDGGWIPTTGAPEDPLPLLEDIAKISAAWYTVTHFVMSLESYRLKPPIDLAIGALVLHAGGGVGNQTGHEFPVNAPITEIKFTYPRGTSEKTPAAKMAIKTWAGELDAVQFVKPRPLETLVHNQQIREWINQQPTRGGGLEP